jgi:hypothetical protein
VTVDGTTSGDLDAGRKSSQPNLMSSNANTTPANSSLAGSPDKRTTTSIHSSSATPQGQKSDMVSQSSSLEPSASSSRLQNIHSNNGSADPNIPMDMDDSDSNDLSRRIPAMFRVLDLIGEHGSGGIGKRSS